jgi:hypothetical protein
MNLNNKFLSQAQNSNKDLNFPSNFLIENKPVYLHNWCKYFIFSIQTDNASTKNEKPNININNIYFTTFNNKTDISSNKDYLVKDKIDYVNIPTESSFFAILTRKNINILNSRKTQTAKTVELIDLKEINFDISVLGSRKFRIEANDTNTDSDYAKNSNSTETATNTNKTDETNQTYPEPLEDSKKEKIARLTAIKDIGSFNEGFCLVLTTKNQKSYTFCFENEEIKNLWVKTLIKLIIKANQDQLDIKKLQNLLDIADEIINSNNGNNSNNNSNNSNNNSNDNNNKETPHAIIEPG